MIELAARRVRSRRVVRERFPRHRSQQSIERLLGELIENHGLGEEVRERCVFVFWSEMVGERVAARTSPESLVRGMLKVSTGSSVQVQELQFHRVRMLQQINDWIAGQRTWLGEGPLVTEVRIVLGSQRTRRDEPDPAIRARQRQLRLLRPQPVLGESDRIAICAETEAIEDPELRAVVESVRLRWVR